MLSDVDIIFLQAFGYHALALGPGICVLAFSTQQGRGARDKPLENLGRSPSTEIHARIALAVEAREGQNTRDKAEHLTAVSDHFFEEMMTTCRPPGIAGDVACRQLQN